MDDLVERISASIENRSADPWFPEFTADLAARAWGRLQRELGLTHESYCTERVLSRNLSAPREVIRYIKIYPATCDTASTISIEALTEKCSVKYQQQGVSFYSPYEIRHTTVLDCLEDALAVVKQVPSMMRTVSALARSLHLLKPADEDHDVSFSEPYVPFSIFVSVPEKRVANDALRVAEAIVHETMHLQLTLIEQAQPLINRNDGRYFSPWRREHRNAQGLLHGLYVFRVISRFLGELKMSGPSDLDYVSGRRSEIAAEVNQIRGFSDCSELTGIGSTFAGRLLSSVMNHG